MKEKTAQLKNIYAAFNADTRDLIQDGKKTLGLRQVVTATPRPPVRRPRPKTRPTGNCIRPATR